MPQLFFYISGETNHCLQLKLKPLLEAENCKFTDFKVYEPLVRLEADVYCTKTEQDRAAFTRATAQEIFLSDATNQAIQKPQTT